MYHVLDLSKKDTLPTAVTKDGEALLTKNLKFWVLYSMLHAPKVTGLKEHLLEQFDDSEEAMDTLRLELGGLIDFPLKENVAPAITEMVEEMFPEKSEPKEVLG